MKLIKFNNSMSLKYQKLKETHGVPQAGDQLVVSDDRAEFLCAKKYAEILEDVITVPAGKGEWAFNVILEASRRAKQQEKQAAEIPSRIPAENSGEVKKFVTFSTPVTEEEADDRVDAAIKSEVSESAPKAVKKKTPRKTK